MSRRAIDSRGEKAMGVFLDKYFYSRAYEARILSYAKRIYDKEHQIQGIDIILNDRAVDEKAQLYYINRPRDSFAFEIDYYNEEKKTIVDGWYIEPNNQTQDYLLLWIPKARTAQINRLVSEDFEVVEANLISKNHIKEYLKTIGVTDQILKTTAQEMRRNNIERKSINEDIHLTYSFKENSFIDYSEKPINMVVKKELLDHMSTKRFEISKEDFAIIP